MYILNVFDYSALIILHRSARCHLFVYLLQSQLIFPTNYLDIIIKP